MCSDQCALINIFTFCAEFSIFTSDSGSVVAPPVANGEYGIALEQLSSMTRDHNMSALKQYGGVCHSFLYLVIKFNILKTNDLSHR